MYIYGRNVLLTGGSSGIGLATAKLLAKNGYIVYAASRNPHADTPNFPNGGAIHHIELNLCDNTSIAAIYEQLKPVGIGIIIHCAGMGIASPAEYYDSGSVNNLFTTNFFGILQLNSLFLQDMRKYRKGLCITVGSVGGVFAIPFQAHYSASKAALDAYTMALRMELAKYNVQVCLVMPGDTNTGFTAARKYVIEKSSPYYNDCLKSVEKMERDEVSGKAPETCANVILKICKSKKPPARKTVGLDYKILILLKRLLPYCVIESALRKTYIKK